MYNFRSTLSGLKTLQNLGPKFVDADLPDHPVDFFSTWLREAIDAGIPEPHAMTLSTVDENNMPDARVLILKDIDKEGWHFASGKMSQKGIQLDAYPNAALTFYWQQLGRSVRVRGPVKNLGSKRGVDDFNARSAGARAVALMGAQSQILNSLDNLADSYERSFDNLQQNPSLTSEEWRVYAVRPISVEFWQGDINRCHQRVRYTITDSENYNKEYLWP